MANPGLNICIFSGNVGQDPKVITLQSGKKMATTSLAVSRYTGSGEGRKEITDWIQLVAFERQAEIMESYVTKGSRLEVQTRLQTRSYEKDGQTKYVTEFVVNQLNLAGAPKSQNGASAESSDGQAAYEPTLTEELEGTAPTNGTPTVAVAPQKPKGLPF